MKTIVYYGEDGSAAKKRVNSLRMMDEQAQAIAAVAFCGEQIHADAIEFMPDVPDWHERRIRDAFAAQKAHEAEKAAEDKRRREARAHLQSESVPYTEDSFRKAMTSRVTVAHAEAMATAEELPAPQVKRGPGRPPKAKPQE